MATRVAELVDTSTFDAQGRPGLQYRRIRGVRVVLEWVARRLLCPRDGLPWALGTCIDLAGYVNGALTPLQLQRLKSVCDTEVAKVEYVTSVQSTMALDNNGTLWYRVRVAVAGSGTYPLAVSIDKAAQVLAQFPIAA